MRCRRATCAVAVATLASGAAALAGPPGLWTPLSKGAMAPADEPALVRGQDGSLNVAWERRAGSVSALWRTRVDPDGTATGSDAVAGGLDEGGPPGLTLAPDGSVRAFFFARSADGSGADLHLAVAAANGAWTPVAAPLAHVADTSSPPVGAAAARDGTPLAAWSGGTQVHYRFGVDPAAPAVALGVGGCCATSVQPAVDQVSGQAYVGWASDAAEGAGVYTQAVDRAGATQPKVYATGSANKKRSKSVVPAGRVALAARPGLPGVFLAYAGGYPKVKAIDVIQVGARKVLFTVKAPGAANVALSAGPQGRLWIAWSNGGTVFATRTDRDLTHLGAIRKIPVRRGSTAVAELAIDGTPGPVDLVASLVSRAGAVSVWHQQVLPGLLLAATATPVKGGPTRYVFSVSDAGEPVANAAVKVGKQTLTTGLAGTVILSTSDHPPTVTASKLGYAPATTPLP